MKTSVIDKDSNLPAFNQFKQHLNINEDAKGPLRCARRLISAFLRHEACYLILLNVNHGMIELLIVEYH